MCPGLCTKIGRPDLARGGADDGHARALSHSSCRGAALHPTGRTIGLSACPPWFAGSRVAGGCGKPVRRWCLADVPRVISDIFDFTAEAAHFATLVRALCARPETSRRPGHTIGMVGKAQEVPGSARNGLVLRERRRKNHYTEFEFFRATTRRFFVCRPFQPEPPGSAGRGTLSRWYGNTLHPLVAPENASFRVRSGEKTITQMSAYRIFTPHAGNQHNN